jgi:hypothetical protein
VDLAVFAGSHSAHAVARDGDVWRVSDGSGGETRLHAVERLQFDDGKLALDLDGNAGTVARVLGAVFGATAVVNAAYVGIGLQLADAGTSPQALVQLALDARLGPVASAGEVVDLLFGMQQRHGATLVLITHDPRLAALCERTVHMADGQLDARARELAPA